MAEKKPPIRNKKSSSSRTGSPSAYKPAKKRRKKKLTGPEQELKALRSRLAEAEETLQAIRSGEVDAVVVSRHGVDDQIFTLKGVDHAYRVLVEEMNEGAATVSSEGSLLFVNNALASLLGLPLEKIIGTSFRRHIPEQSLPQFDQFLDQSLMGQSRIETALSAQGRAVPVLLSGKILPAEDAVRVSIIVTDISERKKSEEALRKAYVIMEQQVEDRTRELSETNISLLAEIAVRKHVQYELQNHKIEVDAQNDELRLAQRQLEASQSKYSDLFEFAPIGYLSLDPSGVITDINLAGAQILGYPKQSIVSKPLSLFVTLESRHLFAEHRRSLSSDIRQHCEISMKSSGGPVHVHVESIAEQNPDPGLPASILMTIRDITERKRAEDALRQSEERFRVAQDLSLDAFTILTAIRGTNGAIEDFQWQYVNPKAGTYLRHAPAHLVGRRLLQVLPGNETDNDLFERYVRVVETGEPHDYELRYDADGVSGWFRNMAVKLGDGVAVYFADITGRKGNEERMRQQEELYRTLAENSPDFIARHDRKYRHIYVNSRIAAFEGRKQEDFVGKTLEDIGFPPDIAHTWNGIFERVFETGREESIEFSIPGPDGVRHIHRTLVPEFGPDGSVQTVLAIGRDITERKRAEEALRDSIERFQRLVEQSQDGIIMIDQEGTLVEWNRGQENITGIPRSEALGRPLWEMQARLAPASRQSLAYEVSRERVTKALQKGIALRRVVEEEIRKPDGAQAYVQSIVFTIDTSRGRFAVSIMRDITERTQSEIALRKERDRAQQYLDIAGSIIVALDRQGLVTLVNQKGCEILGHAEEDIIGRNWFDQYLPEQQRATVQGLFTAMVEERTPLVEQYENPVLTSDGKVRLISWQNSIVRDAAGTITGMLSSGMDITERKQAEDALQVSEALVIERLAELQAIYDSAPVGLCVFDLDLRFLRLNKRMAEINGVSLEEHLGRTVGDVVPDLMADTAAALKRILETGQPLLDLEIHGQTPARPGEERTWHARWFPIRNAGGQISAVNVVAEEITERKRAEKALRESEERNRSLLDFTPLGMLLMDSAGIHWANPSAVRLWGAWNEQELLTRPPATLFHPSSHDLLESDVRGLRKDSPVKTREKKIVTFDGTLRDVEVTAVPFSDDRGSSVLMMLNDITGRKRAEAELQQSEARLRSLFENAGDAIFLLQAEGEFAGSILAANKAAADMHGYTLAELMNMHISALDGPEDAGQVPDRLQRIMKGEWLKTELMHRRKDGSLFPVEISTGLVTSGDQKFILAFDRDISSRKAAEEAIRESREQYLRLFNTVSDGIVLYALKTDSDPGRFTMVNETMCRMLGYSEEEMQGMTLYDIIPPDEVPDADEDRQVLRSKGHHTHKKTLVMKSGGHIPVEISSRVFDHKGVLMALSVIRDITERTIAEDRIQHQHALLNAINLIFRETLNIETEEELLRVCLAAAETVTQSRCGFIAEIAQDGLLHSRIFSNPGWELCTMLNKSGHGANPVFKIHGVYSRVIIDRRTFFTNDPVSHPDSVGLPPGHPPLTAFLGVPLISHGVVIGMIGLGNRPGGYRSDDLESLDALAVATVQVLMNKRVAMEIKRLNQDLRRRVSELETVFNTVPIGLAIAEDAQGLHIRGNLANQEIMGVQDGEFSKKAPKPPRFRVLQEGRELDIAELPMQRAVRGETISGLIVDLERYDRRMIKLHCSATPLLDEQGRPRGAVGAFLDITSMIRAEEEIAKLNRELNQNLVTLQATNRELEAFVYSVSHDLRAPLRSIKGFSDFLLQDYANLLDERGKGYLDRVLRNTGKMDNIIDDLLHLSRISRQQLDRMDVDLSQLVTAHLAELANADPERTVAVEVRQGLQAKADPRLIRAAIGNLLNNAWKFSSKTAAPRIEFGIFNKNGEQVYFIRDNGAGFDEAFSKKLFLPFHRLHSEHEFEGSGIGLAIVERVIRKHGGRVWAEGKPNEGACFYFTLE